jgi:hypothetical protein
VHRLNSLTVSDGAGMTAGFCTLEIAGGNLSVARSADLRVYHLRGSSLSSIDVSGSVLRVVSAGPVNVNTIGIDNAEVWYSAPLAATTMALSNGSILTHHSASTTKVYSLELQVGSLAVDSTSRIDVSGKGYLGGNVGDNTGQYQPGRTLGNALGAGGYTSAGLGAAGGSYGGLGGPRNDGTGVVLGYGDYRNPNELGSGGGSVGSAASSCKNGGGLVRIIATGSGGIVLDGSIVADGADGPCGFGGGGSGGGVLIDTTTLTGAGAISADGGAGGRPAGYYYSAGGGGRIAIHFGDISGFDLANVSAAGGAGGDAATGGAGTVFLQDAVQEHGDLVVDNRGRVARTSSTVLRAIGAGTIDSVVDAGGGIWVLTDTRNFAVPDPATGALGLVGLELDPDTTQGTTTFTIVDNTLHTISVNGDLSGLVSSPYIGVYTFGTIDIQGGAKVTTGDQVLGTINIHDADSDLQAANYP